MSDLKKCPFCAEEIKAEAKKCKHCSESLDNNNVQPETSQQSNPDIIEKPKKNNLIGIMVFVILALIALYFFSNWYYRT